MVNPIISFPFCEMKKPGTYSNAPGFHGLWLITDLAVFDLARLRFGQALDSIGFVLVIEQQGEPRPTTGDFSQSLDRRQLCLELADMPAGRQLEPFDMAGGPGPGSPL